MFRINLDRWCGSARNLIARLYLKWFLNPLQLRKYRTRRRLMAAISAEHNQKLKNVSRLSSNLCIGFLARCKFSMSISILNKSFIFPLSRYTIILQLSSKREGKSTGSASPRKMRKLDCLRKEKQKEMRITWHMQGRNIRRRGELSVIWISLSAASKSLITFRCCSWLAPRAANAFAIRGFLI